MNRVDDTSVIGIAWDLQEAKCIYIVEIAC